MSIRAPLAAALLAVLAGCGGADEAREVRLLAPVGVVDDTRPFETATGCRVELRVYDRDEDLDAIARRRDTDAIAAPTPPGGVAHVSQQLARVTLEGDVVVTVPSELASAFRSADVRPAGRRELTWTIRPPGANEDCARRWLAYATSQ